MLFTHSIIEFVYGANVPNDNDNSGWGGASRLAACHLHKCHLALKLSSIFLTTLSNEACGSEQARQCRSDKIHRPMTQTMKTANA